VKSWAESASTWNNGCLFVEERHSEAPRFFQRGEESRARRKLPRVWQLCFDANGFNAQRVIVGPAKGVTVSTICQQNCIFSNYRRNLKAPHFGTYDDKI
jgi:hypothetical protein